MLTGFTGVFPKHLGDMANKKPPHFRPFVSSTQCVHTLVSNNETAIIWQF